MVEAAGIEPCWSKNPNLKTGRPKWKRCETSAEAVIRIKFSGKHTWIIVA
jgi:hypothetical protein